jgi:hypothetical protein
LDAPDDWEERFKQVVADGEIARQLRDLPTMSELIFKLGFLG